MTPTDKQNLWNAILKLNNKPYIGSGYEAYNNVKNPALRGGLYNWKYRDMRDLYEQLVKYCELGEYEATWRVLQKYKTKIYPAYLRKIYQSLTCTPAPPVCPAIGDSWHGGTVFFIDGNDYYVASSIDFDRSGLWFMCTAIGFNLGTQAPITESYNNTVLLSNPPCGPGLASEVLLPITENGYSDWFIPSIDALQLIFAQFPGILNPAEDYWSSTEANDNNMFVLDNSGAVKLFNKTGSGVLWTKLIRKETCI